MWGRDTGCLAARHNEAPPKALADPQGSWLYQGKQFPQVCPSKGPHQPSPRQAHTSPTLSFTLPSRIPPFQHPAPAAPRRRSDPQRGTRSPRPGLPLPACLWGPEAAAPRTGWAESVYQVRSSRFAARSREAAGNPCQPHRKGNRMARAALKRKRHEPNRHLAAGSPRQRFRLSPRQRALRAFYRCRFLSSSKAGGTAFTPTPRAALAKRRAVSVANMQLLGAWLGRHVGPCSRGG